MTKTVCAGVGVWANRNKKTKKFWEEGILNRH